MALFGFLKKKDEEVAPDIGNEEVISAEPEDSQANENFDTAVAKVEEPAVENAKPGKKSKGKKAAYVDDSDSESPIISGVSSSVVSSAKDNLEFQKLNARVESLTELYKSFTERFTMINQQIGEIRSLSQSNEKEMSKLSENSTRVIDIVNEVKPEKLRLDFQKAEAKVEELAGRLEAQKQFADSMTEEIKDLRRKSSLFVGADALVKLNEDVKKDLITTQQISSKAKMHADKVEQIFVEMNRNAADIQKSMALVSTLDSNYSGLQKDMEKLRVDYINFATKNDVAAAKRFVQSKSSILEDALARMEKAKTNSERMERVVETTLNIAQENKRDIENIAMKIGDSEISKVNEYDQRLDSILLVIDKIAAQVSQMRKLLGLASESEMPVDVSKDLQSLQAIEPETKVNANPDSTDVTLNGNNGDENKKAEEQSLDNKSGGENQDDSKDSSPSEIPEDKNADENEVKDEEDSKIEQKEKDEGKDEGKPVKKQKKTSNKRESKRKEILDDSLKESSAVKEEPGKQANQSAENSQNAEKKPAEKADSDLKNVNAAEISAKTRNNLSLKNQYPTSSNLFLSADNIAPTHLVLMRSASLEMLAYLWMIIQHKSSILIAGDSSASRNRLLKSLSLFIPSKEEPAVVNDSAEIALLREKWLPMPSFSAHKSRVFSKQNPGYLVVKNIEGENTSFLFNESASGRAFLGAINASSTDDALAKLQASPINLSSALLNFLECIAVIDNSSSILRVKKLVEIVKVNSDNTILINTPMIFDNASGKFVLKKQSKILMKIANKEKIYFEKLQSELMKRTAFLRSLCDKKVFNVDEFQNAINDYYSNPAQALKKYSA